MGRLKSGREKYYDRKKKYYQELLKEMGCRLTKPKKTNPVRERAWQDEATRLWKLYGWFIQPDEKIVDQIEKDMKKNGFE